MISPLVLNLYDFGVQGNNGTAGFIISILNELYLLLFLKSRSSDVRGHVCIGHLTILIWGLTFSSFKFFLLPGVKLISCVPFHKEEEEH